MVQSSKSNVEIVFSFFESKIRNTYLVIRVPAKSERL